MFESARRLCAGRNADVGRWHRSPRGRRIELGIRLHQDVHCAIPALKDLDNSGLEGGARHRGNVLHGGIERHGIAVLAMRGQCVQAIDGGQDARARRNLFAFQPVGIARSVPALVVRADDGRDRIGKRDALQDLGPHQGVDLHLFEFFRGQASGLIDDVFGNGQLPNVVEQRRGAQGFDFALGEAQFFRHLDREYAHPL